MSTVQVWDKVSLPFSWLPPMWLNSVTWTKLRQLAMTLRDLPLATDLVDGATCKIDFWLLPFSGTYNNNYESADFKVSIDWPGIDDRAKSSSRVLRIEEVGQPIILVSLDRTLAIPIQRPCATVIFRKLLFKGIFDYVTLHASVS